MKEFDFPLTPMIKPGSTQAILPFNLNHGLCLYQQASLLFD